jgi:hypothetical protein
VFTNVANAPPDTESRKELAFRNTPIRIDDRSIAFTAAGFVGVTSVRLG